jgi:hypothetical protein
VAGREREIECVCVCVFAGLFVVAGVIARACSVVREREKEREFASRDKTKKTTILLYYY